MLFLTKPLLRVHFPRHPPHLHERKVRPPVHKDISGVFFFNAVLLGSLLPVFFLLLDKDGSVVRIPFWKSTDWVRDFFVRKEKPFGWCKVRHKIADYLESGYDLTLLPACKGLHEGGRAPDIRNGAGGLLKGQGVFSERK